MKMLKGHLATEHKLSLAEYRERSDLPGSYPMVAPRYRALRQEMAKNMGLGRKPRAS